MTQPSTPAIQPTYMKVFVQRDYSDGTSVKFQTRFPPELEGRVSLFVYLYNTIDDNLFEYIIQLTLGLMIFSIITELQCTLSAILLLVGTTAFRSNNL